MSALWALVPLKRLATAKQRLAAVLEPAPRAALMLSMAADVLAVLVQIEALDRVLLVSDDPEVESIARNAGAGWLCVSPGGDLNTDLQFAATFAHEQGAGQVLIVHADLPFLNVEALLKFIAGMPSQSTRLARCKAASGTNALLTPLPLGFALVFGRHSLARFQQLPGETVEVVHHSALGMDIDNPEDLNCLLAGQHGGTALGPLTRAWVDQYRHLLLQGT